MAEATLVSTVLITCCCALKIALDLAYTIEEGERLWKVYYLLESEASLTQIVHGPIAKHFFIFHIGCFFDLLVEL